MKDMTFMINIGKWGGFYADFSGSWRICLGWVAFTVMFSDIDDRLTEWAAMSDFLEHEGIDRQQVVDIFLEKYKNCQPPE